MAFPSKVSALLLFAAASAALNLFLLLPSLFPSPSCLTSYPPVPTKVGARSDHRMPEQIFPTLDDIKWIRAQIHGNSLPDPSNSPHVWHSLRKGINPRTREQQLEDLLRFKGISHYEDAGNIHTALPCPGELLVEEHHSNYRYPWAGGRDVFEFLASAISLRPSDLLLEVGCGTLRVGLHFIRYFDSGPYSCLELVELLLLAPLRCVLSSQGLLYKRPFILKGNDMDFCQF